MAQLTPQQNAALDTQHNILVEAGAGSGKTTVFVRRYCQLLLDYPDCQIPDIVAITFTNKAAQELSERIYTALSDPAFSVSYQRRQQLLRQLPQARISTIHGFCQRILKQFPLQAGLDPDFSIMDDTDRLFLTQSAIAQGIATLSQHQSEPLRFFLFHHSLPQLTRYLHTLLEKRDLIPPFTQSDPPTLGTQLEHALRAIFEPILDTYSAIKHAQGRLDYSDLLAYALQLTQIRSCRESLQEQVRFIMVDEFQDTDPAQWQLIQSLCDAPSLSDTKKLFIVGDIKQAIYSFRGAQSGLLSDLMTDFQAEPGHAKVIQMADNFRTQPPIIDFINGLFSTLFDDHHYTPLIAQRDDTGASICMGLLDDYSLEHEITLIADWIIDQCLANPARQFSDFAILSRRKKPFDAIKAAFAKRGIPAQISQNRTFFQQSCILDLIQLVSALALGSDLLSWLGVLSSSFIGLSAQARFTLMTQVNGLSLDDKLADIAQNPSLFFRTHSLPDPDQHILTQLLSWLPRWQALLQTNGLCATLDQVIADTQAMDLYRQIDPLNESLIEGFKALVAQLSLTQHLSVFECHERLIYFMKRPGKGSIPIPNPPLNAVQLLTIHAAKGLEFPCVAIMELHHPFNFSKSASLLVRPSGLGLSTPDQPNQKREDLLSEIETSTIAEEKRLFYVALTRAKDHLLLTGKPLQAQKERSFPCHYLSFLAAEMTVDEDAVHFDWSPTAYPLFRGPMSEPPTLNIPHQPAQQASLFPPSLLPTSRPATAMDTPDQPPSMITVTQLIRALACPKQYRLSHVTQTGIPITGTPLSQIKYRSQAHVLGDLIHQSFLARHRSETTSPESICETLFSGPSFVDPEIRDAQRQDVMSALSRYEASPCFQLIQSAEQVLVEHPFSVRMGPFLLEGRFDMSYFSNGHWHIIDYKTNAEPEKAIQSLAYRQQMILYQWALCQQYGTPITKISTALFLTQSAQLHPISICEQEREQLLERIQQLDLHLEPREHTPRPDCKRCPVYALDPDCYDRGLG